MVAAPGGSIVEDPDQSKVCRTDICVFGCEADRNKLKAYFEVSCDGVFKCFFFSSPEHKVLRVSYCDRSLSVVRRRASSVVRRASCVVRRP